MCPWVGPHAPSFGPQLWGLPSRVEYLSPQGVLLPLLYGTTASLLWIELRGHSAWQGTPSWTVYRLASHWLLPSLRVMFAMVPDAAWSGSDQWPWSTAPATGPLGRLNRPSVSDAWGVGSFLSLGRPTCVQCPGPLGSRSPVRPLGVLCCVCGVLGHLAPVHGCDRSVCCFACAVSWASWLLFISVLARCVVLPVRCPGPLGSCSPVRLLGVLCCVCGVLGHLAPVHRCARWVCCVAWAVPGPRGSCSAVCSLGVLCCVCGVLGHVAPVHRCARWVPLCCVCGVLGHWAPVHQCACSVCCFASAVSWASWLLFTGVLARCVVLHERCPGPLGSCSPVRPPGVLCCVCGVLGHWAPVQRCARSVCCVACAVSWATWLLFTSVPARCVVLRVRCPGPLGSCSPVRPLGVLCCVCGVLGHLAPVHRCARSVCCFACAVSSATRLLFTGAPARCVVLRVRCPGPLGSCSPVRLLVVLCCVCGVLGHLAPVHRCARWVCCLACAVSRASWHLFTGAPAGCVVLRGRCPGRIRATILVQAATLGEGVRDFLFKAFLHVARHDRPPLATPDSKRPPSTGDRIWVPPIDLGRQLVRHPVLEQVDTQGRTRYREPHMAHPPPSATPGDTKEWGRETWVAWKASLSNCRHHVPGDIPTPDDRQPAPSTYMTLMYKLNYTLSATHYHARTGHWPVHGTDFLHPADYAPPPHNPGLDTYTREDERDDPHLWGTWERKSLDTLLSIRSGNQGLRRAMYCLAKWTQQTWGIPTDRWLWKVMLRPQQREALPNRRGPTRPRYTSLQLRRCMVAARLMALLWPGPDSPTQS